MYFSSFRQIGGMIQKDILSESGGRGVNTAFLIVRIILILRIIDIR